MSYPNYPQYPQYPPQFQPGGGTAGPAGPGGSLDVPQPKPQDVYVPITQVVPPDADWANVRSAQLTSIAAGKAPAELGVKQPDPPADFPMAMYNPQKRDVKPAKDKDDKQKLEGQGYTDQPFPAEDPNAGALAALQALSDIWTKAGEALKQLIQIVQQQQKQMQAASNVLGAGQQQQPQSQWDQQQYQQQYPPTGD